MGFLTDNMIPIEEFVYSPQRAELRATFSLTTPRAAKRWWATWYSHRAIEEQGYLWRLPRGRIFGSVDRYIRKQVLAGRTDVTVEEALEHTGMMARFRHQRPRRSPDQRRLQFDDLIREVATRQLEQFHYGFPTPIEVHLHAAA